MRFQLAILSICLIFAGCAGQQAAHTEDMKTCTGADADAAAMRHLGMIYLNGEGVIQDTSKAVECLTKAADSDASAQFTLGVLYQTGNHGVAKDPSRGHALILQAARQGLPMAEAAVGYEFEQGLGTPVDYTEALTWLKKGADDGESVAYEDLGHMYLNGLGVQKDQGKGMSFYERAAELGNRPSQLFLANVFHNGYYGVQKDEALSKRYYAQASEGVMRSYGEMAETMREIIDSHKLYPKEAVAAKQAGVATVEFDCALRTPDHVTVVQSTGFPLLDAAAIQAVQESYFPDRDPQLKSLRHFRIGVNFEFDSPSTSAPGGVTSTAPAAATAR